MKRNGRAYALPLVLVVLSVVALSVASLAYALEAATAEAGRIVGDIRGRAGCDAMLGIASAVVQDTLKAKPSTTTAALVEAVCAEASSCTTNSFHRRVPGAIAPPGMALDDFSVHYANNGAINAIRPITTGGLAGVISEERLLSVYVRGHDTRSGRECIGQQDLTLSSLSPLQLNMMVVPNSELTPPTSLSIQRLHNNRGLSLSNVTATHHSDEHDARLGPSAVTPSMQAPNNSVDDALHWLIDPAMSDDTDDVRRMRLASIADLRIVDGVWYVRDNALPWPGRAIWSDHPGNGVGHKDAAARLVQSGAGIGQRDIYPSGARPTGYSLYEADDSGKLIDSDGGVISYGAVAPTPQGPTPAAYPSFETDALGTPLATDVCGGTGAFRAIDGCSGRAQAVMDATRTGFEHNGVNVLPINFDVEAFTAAMKSSAARELGSYFPASRPFNGIVWITQTWKDADKGLKHGDGGGHFAPAAQGSIGLPATIGAPVVACDTRDAVAANAGGGVGGGTVTGGGSRPCPPANSSDAATVQARAQTSTPRTVCGGAAIAGSEAAGQFDVVSCDDTSVWGSSGAEGAQPNALRIIRGALIDHTVFPAGLTIATNLPMYVHGDVNTAPMTVAGTPIARRKVLLAADRVTLLSNQFSDATRPWNTSRPLAMAGNISIVASVITGVPSDSSNVDQAFRSAEAWRERYASFVGSVVIGFNSVHDRQAGAVIGLNKGLKLQPDPHLADPLIQPPGTPRVVAGITGHWRR